MEKPDIDHPLRRWRKAQGLSIAKAAAIVGASKGLWHDWETGRRMPSRRTMPLVRELTDGLVDADIFYPSQKDDS
jgi:transcriptional regulator with XRE-family HTH domain